MPEAAQPGRVLFDSGAGHNLPRGMRVVWPHSQRDVAIQSMVTYTAVRGSNHPRFQPLGHHEHGAFRNGGPVC